MSPKFITDLYSQAEANVIVFGVPIAKNSKRVLASLRKTSDLVESFDLDRETNLFDSIRVADIGDLRLKRVNEITEKCKEILSVRKFPLMLTRGHFSSLFSLKAFDDDVKLIVFDAHADLKNKYLDSIMASYYSSLIRDKKILSKFNGATWLRRFCEKRKNDVALIGVRSCDEFEFDYMKERNIVFFTPTQIRKKMKNVKKELSKFVKDSKFYISFDIDAFDPSIAPAVEYLEHNGMFFHQFVELMDVFKKGKLVGFDLNVQKYLPGNKKTEFLATRVVLEILNLLSKD